MSLMFTITKCSWYVNKEIKIVKYLHSFVLMIFYYKFLH